MHHTWSNTVKIKMEQTRFLWIVSILFALAFETAFGIECYSCTTTDDRCRRGAMGGRDNAPTKADCLFCTVVYATEPPNYVLRSCRHDEGGFTGTDTECKPSIGGGHRCFCKTDKCNGASMDSHYLDVERGVGDDTGTTPGSSAVSWGFSGMALVGLILVKYFLS